MKDSVKTLLRLIGVILAELVGEIAERIVRGNEKPVHSAVRNPLRNKEK